MTVVLKPHRAIAHVRGAGGERQPLADHLTNVSALAGVFAAKVGLPQSGKLSGLLHDLGKYSQAFQRYINSATGLLDQDHDEYVDAKSLKGKIDHSTAGAQHVWRRLAQRRVAQPYAQLLALSIASHHSGLIDCLAPDGTQVFAQRMGKKDEETHLAECLETCDPGIAKALAALLTPSVLEELHRCTQGIHKRVRGVLPPAATVEECTENESCRTVEQGLLARFLLSCLLDADRIDSAEFEDPTYKDLRARLPRKPWERLIQRLEIHLQKFIKKHPIDSIRSDISEACRQKAASDKGLFTLTVPTGGGKTLASLRFALHHAQQNDMERILYVIPYTSIIDQNAKVARDILEQGEEPGSIVLEHHSNLLPEEENWQSKLLADNWEAPVVFTTMVQFLESLLGSGTRHARRMHNLANSVIIFDEIQTLPLNCVHLFCNALNFLLGVCGASAVLCTATQPCLDALPRPHRGGLSIAPEREIMPDVPTLFTDLKRVTFFDHCDTSFTVQDIADLAQEELSRSGSCLVVCNTKKWAEAVYAACRTQHKGTAYYLSTNLCPAHRLEKLEALRHDLARKEGKPVLCVSTQLIECGVDVSFGSVIRCAAGLDSILQAAGRCNRHGGDIPGRVHIVHAGGENLDMLEDIREGRSIYLGVIRPNCCTRLDASGYDLHHPDIIAEYFRYYFQRRSAVMAYKTPKNFVRDDTLLNMLGGNIYADGNMPHEGMCRQSFAKANGLFQPISAPTTAVVVPYGRGAGIIADFSSTALYSRKRDLLREAQRYSVNLFPNIKDALGSALRNLQESGILALQEGYYHDELGVLTEPYGNFLTHCH